MIPNKEYFLISTYICKFHSRNSSAFEIILFNSCWWERVFSSASKFLNNHSIKYSMNITTNFVYYEGIIAYCLKIQTHNFNNLIFLFLINTYLILFSTTVICVFPKDSCIMPKFNHNSVTSTFIYFPIVVLLAMAPEYSIQVWGFNL